MIGRLRTRVARASRLVRLSLLTTQPLAFARAEHAGARSGTRAWHLRRGGPVVVRHGTRDVDVLEEVFLRGEYSPPPTVRAALGGHDVRTVVDLGANIGLFAVHALRVHPHARVISYEPDEANLALLRRCRESSGAESRWEVHAAAAGAADGAMRFIAGRGPESRSPHAGELDDPAILEVPVRDCLADLAGADLAKIDIEGGEWAILQDARLAERGPTFIVLEYHGQLAPTRERPRGQAHALLQAAGYETENVAEHDIGVGRLWAWRRPPSDPAA